MEKNLDDVMRGVAEEMCLPEEFVSSVYKSYWKAIREHITSLPLKEELTDEEFLSLRPNINIPSIGKLYVTLDRYKGVKKHFNLYMKK